MESHAENKQVTPKHAWAGLVTGNIAKDDFDRPAPRVTEAARSIVPSALPLKMFEHDGVDFTLGQSHMDEWMTGDFVTPSSKRWLESTLL